ncbi:uncharacterized protein LOC130624146 [Hydractinia symbiolongicarpus]|uniref:uncharacterized protein LOC130624146 n=1 Tax=Hydractinia symbiolongicarpus TaxID=13093 RepID=UPI00254DEFAC|nr:uncharacterized protein LOC130624146 [Hydractinia symbiolongicarpus]
MGIMSEYTNLSKKVEQNREMIEKLDIDIQHLASKVEDLKSHDGIASDVKEWMHQMSALKQNDANTLDVNARVMELNCQYSNLYKQLQEVKGIAVRNAADIQGLKRDMENVKLHEDISPKKLRWNIRDNVSNFCGRIEVLDKIHHYLQTTFGKKKYLAIALSGLGGIGKTEVAAKYINRYDKEYQNIIWLECNDIETSLVELASRMQIKTQVYKVNILTQLICDKLGDGKCMFVLNGVVNNKSIKDLMKNLKNMKNTPCVLITSQYS